MISRSEARGLQPDLPFRYFNRQIPGLSSDIGQFFLTQDPVLQQSDTLNRWVAMAYGPGGTAIDVRSLPELCDDTDYLIDYLREANPSLARVVRLQVAHFQSRIQHHLANQLRSGGEHARAIEYVTPVLPVHTDLVEALRLAVIENNHYRLRKSESRFLDETPPATIPKLLADNKVLEQGYDTDRFTDELYDRFFRARSLREALSFRHAMEITKGSGAELSRRLRSLATAYVSPYEPNQEMDLRAKWEAGTFSGFFYNWVFKNDDCSNYGSHGYTDVIKYPLEHIPQLAAFLEETYQGLGGAQRPFSRDGLRALHQFSQSGALDAFQNLIDSRGQSLTKATPESSSGHGKRTGRGGSFDEMDFDLGHRRGGYDRDYRHYGSWDPINLRTKGGRKSGDTASTIQSMFTSRYGRELEGFRESILQLEHLLRWRKFYDGMEGRTDLCTPQITVRDTELIIRGGRNLPLVIHAEDPATITANSVHLGEHMNTLCLSGANGGGKTHTLEMIANNTLLAHRGMEAFAAAMRTPVFGGMEYGVNQAVHKVEGSAFQNWVHYINDVLKRSEDLHGRPGLIILDEPGRGTGAKDAIPLIVGLMKYFQDRRIRFAFSTHFNDLYHHQDLLEQYGLNCGFYTMNRQTHEMVPGMGRSDGLAVARERGMNAEIVTTAEQVLAQAGDREIQLRDTGLAEPSNITEGRAFGPLTYQDLHELGIIRHIRPSHYDSSRTYTEYHQVGPASEIFAENSLFRQWSGMQPAAAEVFYRLLMQEMTESARTERITTFEALLAQTGRSSGRALIEPAVFDYIEKAKLETEPGIITQIRDTLQQIYDAEGQKKMSKADQLHEAVERMKNFFTVFSMGMARKGTVDNPENVLNVLMVAMSGGEYETDERQHQEFLRESHANPPVVILDILNILNNEFPEADFPALAPQLATLRSFTESPAYTVMRDFWARIPDSRKVSEADWRNWVNMCMDHREQIVQLYRTILELNFYATVTRTIQREGFTRVEESTDGEVVLEGLISPSLKHNENEDRRQWEAEQQDEWREPEKKMKEEDILRVVPSDLRFNVADSVMPISGTNGGGKSQGLLAYGATAVYAEQLGYAPAARAKLPRFSFVAAAVNTAEHTEEQSSWQNEVDVLKRIVDNYEAAGSPSGGLIILDEPGKGTSGEEAIPLLIGFMRYFQKRGVSIMFTTHFTGVFDYLDRLDAQSKLAVHPLHVDFFSDEADQRYKLKDGIGESAGVRVAEAMGLPQEIIEIAREAQMRMKD